MKKIIIILSILVTTNTLFAQLGIQTTPVLKQKTAFNFTEEWQYLSSDIYLINPEKFNKLVNDLAFNLNKTTGKKRKRRNSEYIQYLLITAKIKDLKFFGGDLVYPIYNFQFKQGEDQKYNSNISKSIEVIRIIDNLPLIDTKDYVEAEIVGEAITNSKHERINSIVAQSLKSVSKLTNPSTAVMSLIGEYGKVMESNIKKTQYEFSSTIRLYEEQDFDKQLHSINVYIFEIPGIKARKPNTDNLSNFIKTEENPLITRDVLSGMLDYSRYPIMIIVNYKSKYISEPVVGDEVDAETIEIRLQKTKNAYDKALINKDTYLQEMKLIEYLKAFVELKMSINNYKLNYKNSITKDFSKSFFLILQNYRNLKNILQSRDREYSNNTIYKSEFRKLYETILTNAELYLDENNYLKNIKELVNTLFEYENLEKEPTLDEKEQYLRSLYLVELPKTEENSNEVQAITNLAEKLEDAIYNEEYRPLILNLERSVTDSTGLVKIEVLKTKINTSYCKFCKEEVNKAIISFDESYQKILVKKAAIQTDNLKKKAKDLVFKLLMKEECIDKNLKEKYPEETEKPAYITMFEEEYAYLKLRREAMFKLTKEEQNFKNMQELNKFNDKLDVQIQKLDEDYENLCSKVKKLCQCEE